VRQEVLKWLVRAQQAEPLPQNLLMAAPAKLFLPLKNGIIYDDRTEEKPEDAFQKIFWA
jgi:hypothetical protein